MAAVRRLQADETSMRDLREHGKPWGVLKGELEKRLPEASPDKSDVAYRLVEDFLNRSFGERNKAWRTERRPSRNRETAFEWCKAGYVGC